MPRRFLLLAICFTLCNGCTAYVDRTRVFRQEFFAGHLVEARREHERLTHRPGPNADPLALDRALVDLVAGDTAAAKKSLRQIRDRVDSAEQCDVGEKALTMLTDDTRRSYTGEDHEAILMRGLLAVADLFDEGGDVYSYSLQMNEKQRQLTDVRLATRHRAQEEKARKRPKHPPVGPPQPPNESVVMPVDFTEEALPSELADDTPVPPAVALGAYLRAMMHEEFPTEIDDLRRERTAILEAAPEFREGAADHERADAGQRFQAGNGAVYVLAFVGRGPRLEEVSEVPSQMALLIADRMLSQGRHTLPPTIAPIRVPIVVRSAGSIDHLQVRREGQTVGQTSTLVDIGALAAAHAQLRHDEALARAIVRRVVKKGSIYALKEGVKAQRAPEAELLLDLAGIAWEATETADTRCWSLLPDRIQATRIELPAGRHVLTFQPAGVPTFAAAPCTATVPVRAGQFSCVLVDFPDGRAVAPPLVHPRGD